ncbi:MAG: SNF2-related protein [Acidobacteria bacterium]|nr:SNF2-related protein [Acidobacteriota bacterium]
MNGSRVVPLHKRTGSHFQPSDRQRGEQYFREDRVRIEIDGTRARARVEGTDRPVYAVGVDWSQVPAERILHSFCECQRFSGGRPCKHLWATLLALAESGSENQPQGHDRLSLRKDRAGSWTDLGITVHESDASGQPAMRKSRKRVGRRKGMPKGPTTWRSLLDAVPIGMAGVASANPNLAAPGHPPVELHLLINTVASAAAGELILDVFGRGRSSTGKLGKLKRASIDPTDLEALLLPAAETPATVPSLALVAALPITPPPRQSRGRRAKPGAKVAGVQRLRLPRSLHDVILRHLSSQRMLHWWDGRTLRDPPALSWDRGEPWELALRLDVSPSGAARLSGELERKGSTRPLSSANLALPLPEEGSALLVFEDSVGHLRASREHDLAWLSVLQKAGEITIPPEELAEALTALLEVPSLPPLEVPKEMRLSEDSAAPSPRLVLAQPAAPEFMNPPLLAELSFDYGDLQVKAEDPRLSVVDWHGGRFLRRDMDAEHAALVRLLELGLQPVESRNGHGLELNSELVPTVVEPLLSDGWAVEVHGTTVHPASAPALKVESGIDWFELSGQVDFAGDRVDLTQVLGAISRGDRFIELKDGSKGLLPATWMETYGSLANLAHSSSGEGLRFLPSQALLVDALLSAMPPADVDRAFADLRQKLQTFDRIKPKRELKSFDGTLRRYQRKGLGWLNFLREFGLGGVLADDMGLGKTVQVLALIQAHRTPAKTSRLPFLVVAPRSVVYNWIDEAAHFTPKLKSVEYRGPDREALRERLGDYDLVVTTYGTLRRDVAFLATFEFDTVILDEAQAIKNRASQTAKASRLLRARHRLALTGTPIENHLGELGSLFEFLNPGLLGRLPWLDVLNGGHIASKQELALVAKGIRPFILRRTKAEVLPDLPPKTEQVLYCTLRPQQREIYDRLRAKYQASLLEQVEVKGVSGSAIQVLQALLRLRQVACHPGLVDESWEEAGSAKLEALFEQVSEVLEEGHKVLVFSQFTKLLGFVRRHFDAEDVPYAYLDGQTRNRAEEVERFQTDSECNLFLVSLKAGGLGLNLTAAGYVFLLDPWWNPAVEAQAIDRAHRIGQTQPVFAYRLIARDTVEEKILELQSSKRKIADAILEGEGQSLRDLTADDLRLLLS